MIRTLEEFARHVSPEYMKNVYRELRFWSPILGCDAARLSMADAKGQEYFAIVPRETPRLYREVRERALDAIDAAIDSGAQPGEVKL